MPVSASGDHQYNISAGDSTKGTSLVSKLVPSSHNHTQVRSGESSKIAPNFMMSANQKENRSQKQQLANTLRSLQKMLGEVPHNQNIGGVSADK